MKKGNSEPLTASQKAALKKLEAMSDETIDYSDMPPIDDWKGAVRGAFFKPVKKPLSLRLDADLIDYFMRSGGDKKGYQTRINAALREYVSRHKQKHA